MRSKHGPFAQGQHCLAKPFAHVGGGLFVHPGEGWQSCRRSGKGRMAEPAEIQAAIERILAAEMDGPRTRTVRVQLMGTS